MNAEREARAAIFSDVYKNNGWGRAADGRPYYSDSPAAVTGPIRTVVSEFIESHSIRSIVDLGCGDFELASGIDMHDATYIGLDLVPDLIAWDRAHFEKPGRRFEVADIVEDPLPDAELCMIHTVLYILSEKDVFSVLGKLRKFPYVIITDGQPNIPVPDRKNIDKRTDKFTRHDYYNNGFYLELPPYNLHIEILSEYALPSGELMRTVLLDHTR